jgi:hypothetical protein
MCDAVSQMYKPIFGLKEGKFVSEGVALDDSLTLLQI